MDKTILFFVLFCGMFCFLSAEEKCDTTIKNSDTTVVCTSWYKNGKISDIRRLKNKKLDGLNQHWYDNGNLKSSTTFNRGCIIDTAKYFHSNGKKDSFLPYKDCNLHGDIYTYDTTGNLIAEEHFANGKWRGTKKRWYSNGTLKEVTTNDSLGNLDQLSGVYYESGKTNWEAKYTHGKKQNAIQYYENGQLAREEFFTVDGKKIKTGKYYSPEGKLMGEIIDGNGTFVKCNPDYGCTKFYYENGKEIKREKITKEE